VRSKVVRSMVEAMPKGWYPLERGEDREERSEDQTSPSCRKDAHKLGSGRSTDVRGTEMDGPTCSEIWRTVGQNVLIEVELNVGWMIFR
jgi:hypothetical protein